MALTRKQYLLFLGMLITGSINTLTKKAQNDSSSPGYPVTATANNTAADHKFDHPYFQTLFMFLGEMMCVFILICSRLKNNQNVPICNNSERLESRISSKQKSCKLFLKFIRPAVLDLIGTTLSGVGLLYVDASIWQMFRGGSIIIFTGLFSKIFLKRKLGGLQLLGIIIAIIGLVLVGLSGVLKQKHYTNSIEVIKGISLIVVGQLLCAGQMIAEEMLLKDEKIKPVQIVAMEGIIGVLIMAMVVLPALYYTPGKQIGGRFENSLDALYQINNNWKLFIFVNVYMVSVAFYKFFGLAVTQSLTAIHRTLIDACRTIAVWIFGVIIHYATDHVHGEAFDKEYGMLQLDGFALLLIGTALYNEVLEVPCISCLRKSPVEACPDQLHHSLEGRRNNENTPLLQGTESVSYS